MQSAAEIIFRPVPQAGKNSIHFTLHSKRLLFCKRRSPRKCSHFPRHNYQHSVKRKIIYVKSQSTLIGHYSVVLDACAQFGSIWPITKYKSARNEQYFTRTTSFSEMQSFWLCIKSPWLEFPERGKQKENAQVNCAVARREVETKERERTKIEIMYVNISYSSRIKTWAVCATTASKTIGISYLCMYFKSYIPVFKRHFFLNARNFPSTYYVDYIKTQEN